MRYHRHHCDNDLLLFVLVLWTLDSDRTKPNQGGTDNAVGNGCAIVLDVPMLIVLVIGI